MAQTILQVELPQSDRHPGVKITVIHSQGMSETCLDSSHKVMPVSLPEGVDCDDVEIIAQFITVNDEPDPAMQPMLLKEKVNSEEKTDQSGATPGAVEPTNGQVLDANKVDAGGNDVASEPAPRGSDAGDTKESVADDSKGQGQAEATQVVVDSVVVDSVAVDSVAVDSAASPKSRRSSK